MGKKVTILVFLTACVAFFIVAGKYVHDAGLLRKYPKPTYFSDADADTRPVYQQLSDKEKAVYHALYKGISAKESKIPLPYEISGETYAKLYCLVEKQEPSLFYADSTYYTAQKLRDAQIVYREDKELLTEKETEFEKAVRKAALAVSESDSDYNKALKIHDYIVKNCKYTTGEDVPYSSTAYGCLVNGNANCEGYAKAFQCIATDCGLRCILVTGVTDEGENHAWNQVEINGQWRNVDVTWDDIDVEGDKRRLYFLCSDEEFGKTHTADTTYFKPFECSGGSNDYYIMTGSYASTLDQAEEIIRSSLREGRQTIEIKFADQRVYSEFKKNYLDAGAIFSLLNEEAYGYVNGVLTIRDNERENCISLTIE